MTAQLNQPSSQAGTRIYTFWDGPLPEYLKMCLCTWKFPFVLLNRNNVERYLGKIPAKVWQLSLPKVADYIRVHLLNLYGGYWLDVDTIMLNNTLPDANLMGYPDSRAHTIGFLHTNPHSDMYDQWCKYQDSIIDGLPSMKTTDTTPWDIMGNAFTDKYVQTHKDILLSDISLYWPETYMIGGNLPRHTKYVKFYFETNYTISDLKQDLPKMLMLHNSWTPSWYKQLDFDGIITRKCTLSNILASCI